MNDLQVLDKTLRAELEEYYTVKQEQAITRLKYWLHEELSHHVGEMRHALEREEPNVWMALSRVRQMENALAKL